MSEQESGELPSSASINGKDSAHPIVEGDLLSIESWGLSKREYFAGLAFQGIVLGVVATTNEDIPQKTAALAVESADALLEALEKKDE